MNWRHPSNQHLVPRAKQWFSQLKVHTVQSSKKIASSTYASNDSISKQRLSTGAVLVTSKHDAHQHNTSNNVDAIVHYNKYDVENASSKQLPALPVEASVMVWVDGNVVLSESDMPPAARPALRLLLSSGGSLVANTVMKGLGPNLADLLVSDYMQRQKKLDNGKTVKQTAVDNIRIQQSSHFETGVD